MEIALTLTAFLAPAILIGLKTSVSYLEKMSPLIVCYALGLIIGNIGIVQEQHLAVLDLISTIAVALSIPLMLFSVNIRDWFKLAGKTGLSMVLAMVSVIITSAVFYLLIGRGIEEGWKIPGLLVGLYTGGTPNLAAIKTALQVEQNLYLAVHTSDILLGAVYILFVITVARRVFSLILKKADVEHLKSGGNDGHETSYRGFFNREFRFPLIAALFLAIAIFAVGGGLSFIVPQSISTMIVILVITTLSLGASLVPRVRAIPRTFQLGEYFILVFCFAVGAMGNISRLMQSTPRVFIIVMAVLLSTLVVHVLLCRVFRIDLDTMLITSTAAICSPPFVGVVAVALKNRSLIVPGITTGIIGYALGNYLGIAIAHLMKLFA
ncbi:MAG: DUF819 family protein [Spirochaetales bacterium]|uniref:DUF819 family protein n=1 Tax=Candidatus Thalassospirochaeta sargassi TaxID=3119039 RepID=A0AAJ1MKD3_9SPIO|nr:DUF819 family protein [Spirochaetales bacterium]